MSWTCPCGASNSDERSSCRSCDYQLRQRPIQPPPQQQYPPVPYNQTQPPQPHTIFVVNPQQPTFGNQFGAKSPMDAGRFAFGAGAGGAAGIAMGWTIGKFLGCFIILIVVVTGLIILAVVARIFSGNSDNAVPSQTTSAAPTPRTLSPHEERLKELNEKLAGIDSRLQIGIAMGRKMANDLLELSYQPFADPGEKQYMLEQMEEEKQELTRLAQERQSIIAAISGEQGQSIGAATDSSGINAGEPRETRHNCLSYGQWKDGQIEANVQLRGVIRRQTFPGLPNYTSVANGDEPETVWVLNLEDPVCTLYGDQRDDPAEDNVSAMQLTVTDPQAPDIYREYDQLLDHPVTVTGGLWHAVTGHHHTNVMLEVKSIVP